MSARKRGLPPAPLVSAPADRRFRRPDATPERRRRTGRSAWKLVRWATPVALVIAIGAWGAHLVLASSLFLVRDITVAGNSRLSDSDVESLVGGLREENVLTVDFAQYRGRLLSSPWVEQVNLSRVLPATIAISVIEREPMAIARRGEQLYLVDVAGSIIGEYTADYSAFDLPLVDGLFVSSRGGDPVVDPARVRLAAAFLSDLDARPDYRKRLSQVDVSAARDVVVMFDNDPAWLHLGDSDFVARLEHYIEVSPTLKTRFGELDYVDLRFGERVYVRAQGRRGASGAAK